MKFVYKVIYWLLMNLVPLSGLYRSWTYSSQTFFVFLSSSFVFWVIYVDDSWLIMPMIHHWWWRHDDVISQWHTGTGPTPKKNIKKTKFAKNYKISQKPEGKPEVKKITKFSFYLQKIQWANIFWPTKSVYTFYHDLKK